MPQTETRKQLLVDTVEIGGILIYFKISHGSVVTNLR